MLGKALYYRELPSNTEENVIDMHIVNMTLQNNFSDYQII